jgi:hypothetical protein
MPPSFEALGLNWLETASGVVFAISHDPAGCDVLRLLIGDDPIEFDETE